MKWRLLMIVAPAVLITACSDCTKGSGETVESARTVGEFSSVQMSMSADAIIYQDTLLEAPQVIVIAQENILDQINTTVQGGVLVLDSEGCLSSHKDIRFEIRNPVFNRLMIDSSGDIESGNVISGESLEVVLSGSGDLSVTVDVNAIQTEIDGSGDIHLSGDANSNTIDINGSGDLSAFDLATRETSVRVRGSGNANVRVYETLNAVINGSGDVYYRGNPPNVNIDIDGSGTVQPD